MKLFSMAMAMFFALSLNVAPAMADSKSNDNKSSDSRSKDNKSKDSRSKDKQKYTDRIAYERNAVDTRDVRRDRSVNSPAQQDRMMPDWWPFY